jgi:dihydrofolate reductase
LSIWDAVPYILAVGSRTMRRLIYLMNVSLDGFVEGLDGKFGWSRPDKEVHRFHQKRAKDMDGFLYGRRMYETMAVWQTIDESSAMPEYMLEFARIWKSKPKIVFSTTLASVGENCRLVREDLAAELSNLRKQRGGDLGVSGPGLAESLAKLDLIDEYQMVVFPTIVGGGKSYFPSVVREIQLRLAETAKFACGAT